MQAMISVCTLLMSLAAMIKRAECQYAQHQSMLILVIARLLDPLFVRTPTKDLPPPPDKNAP